MNPTSRAPEFDARPVIDLQHGVEVEDRFRWLEDQDSPETRAFLAAEGDAYREYLRNHGKLRRSIETRVRELLAVETVDLPISDRRGGLLYLRRGAEEAQKAVYQQQESGAERLLLSGELVGRDSYASLSILRVSGDGQYLVFGLRTGGEDVQEIGFLDLDQRCLLADRLPRGFHRGLIFDQDRTGFYYAHEEMEGRYQIRRAIRHHTFGQDSRVDEEIFYAGDGPYVRLILKGSESSTSLGYLTVSLESEAQTQFHIHKLPSSGPPQALVDLRGTIFRPNLRENAIEALTTQGAPHGRIVSISLEAPGTEAWREVVPETGDRLSTYDRCGEAIVAHYLDGSIPISRVHAPSGELLREIRYPSDGTVTLGNVDATHNRLFYAYSEVSLPPAIYAADLNTEEHKLWWQQRRPGKSIESTIEKRTFLSRDGVEIPITLVHPPGADARRPVLLSAYGAGGVNNTPKYSALATILAESGITCAVAHVRGGGEGGLGWHLCALKRRKQKSVDDLIAAAEWLIANQHTTAEHLGVAGQSGGALLALCAITQQPDLFRAAMAMGPLSDLTRFHLFGVARGFVGELGSPDDPEEFAALYQLSPYHQVRESARYPSVLIISGDRDKRCDALHARKMIARLHEAVPQSNPILLDYTNHRGHKPAMPLEERIRALADRLTFLIAELLGSSTEERIR